jgi:hypothetical protein
MAEARVEITSCICGTCTDWQSYVGEELMCKAQHNNTKDYYAVAICKSAHLAAAVTTTEPAFEVVGHVSRLISRMCWLFLQKADSRIKCIVSGVRRHSQDLPQGGLEVPCTLKFYGWKG